MRRGVGRESGGYRSVVFAPLRRWRVVLESLWFLPGLILVGCSALSFGLVEIDRAASPSGSVVFGGDGAAAGTVLSVLAGSLITVAGVSLSLTVLVLQLASSQFSPRVLPNFLGDRLTQVTVGGFVGIFAFSLIALRSVGGGFVPRLTVTVASGLGIVAVILLVVFIHHVSKMIQVSEIAGRLGRATMRRLDSLYPEQYGHEEDDASADEEVASWRRSGRPHEITAHRAGYVVDANLHALAGALDGRGARVHVAVCPGDFVTPAQIVAEYWGDEPEAARRAVRRAVGIANQRSSSTDLAFGVRQLTDVAVRALSASLNDPTTARTCIGYLRGILERLAGRCFPRRLRRFDDSDATVVAVRREFPDYAHSLLEVGRNAGSAVEVTEALLDACDAVAERAERAGAVGRARAVRAVKEAIVEHAGEEPRTRLDRERVERGAASRGEAGA